MRRAVGGAARTAGRAAIATSRSGMRRIFRLERRAALASRRAAPGAA